MLLQKPFVFDGISSEEYGLIIEYLSDSADRELDLGTKSDIVEDRLPRRIKPIHYGTNINSPMTFNIMFGTYDDYLDTETVDEVIGWMTGHSSYKFLEVEMDDDYIMRLKCIVTELQPVYINGLPIGFNCTILSDGQFSYGDEKVFTSSAGELVINNISVHNGYVYPIVTATNTSTLKIENTTDGSTMEFAGMPSGQYTFEIDCENQIVNIEGGTNINPYQYFTGKFLRLVKGRNVLEITADGDVEIRYTPMNKSYSTVA